MPNYVNITLSVNGKGAAEFARSAKDAEGDFSFSSLRPVPEPLLSDTWQNNPEVSKANTKEFGFSGWYDWRVAKWGTKWEAIEPTDIGVGPEHYSVSFLTAWSPPTAWVEYVSAKFPELDFTMEYHEEAGMYDSEIVKFKDGEVTERETIPNANIDEDEGFQNEVA